MHKEIGFDGDGVLIDSAIPVIAATNDLLAKELPKLKIPVFTYSPKEISRWDFLSTDIYFRTGDLTLARTAENFWFDPGVLLKSPPISHARLVTRILKALGYSQQVVTSRNPSLSQSTGAWFAREMPIFAKPGRINMREDGNLTKSGPFKLSQIETKRITFFVDDDPKVHETLSGSGIRHYMFTQPWNIDRHDFDKIRVSNWFEILGLVLLTK